MLDFTKAGWRTLLPVVVTTVVAAFAVGSAPESVTVDWNAPFWEPPLARWGNAGWGRLLAVGIAPACAWLGGRRGPVGAWLAGACVALAGFGGLGGGILLVAALLLQKGLRTGIWGALAGLVLGLMPLLAGFWMVLGPLLALVVLPRWRLSLWLMLGFLVPLGFTLQHNQRHGVSAPIHANIAVELLQGMPPNFVDSPRLPFHVPAGDSLTSRAHQVASIQQDRWLSVGEVHEHWVAEGRRVEWTQAAALWVRKTHLSLGHSGVLLAIVTMVGLTGLWLAPLAGVGRVLSAAILALGFGAADPAQVRMLVPLLALGATGWVGPKKIRLWMIAVPQVLFLIPPLAPWLPHNKLVDPPPCQSNTPKHAPQAYAGATRALAGGDRAEAEEQLRTSLSTHPHFVPGGVDLSGLLLEQHRFDEAADIATAMVAADPCAHQALSNLGVALMNLGREPEAARALEAAVRLEPYTPSLWALLGEVYVTLGREADARVLFDRATRWMPGDPRPRVLLARLLMKNEDYPTAGRLFDEALVMSPDEVEIMAWSGLAAFGGGDLDKARRRFEQANGRDARHPATQALARALRLAPPPQ